MYIKDSYHITHGLNARASLVGSFMFSSERRMPNLLFTGAAAPRTYSTVRGERESDARQVTTLITASSTPLTEQSSHSL